MDPGYITIAVLIGLGVLAGRRRNSGTPPKSSSVVPMVLTLAALVGGLLMAAAAESETWIWLFGGALMLALPAAVFYSIGHAIGARRKDRG